MRKLVTLAALALTLAGCNPGALVESAVGTAITGGSGSAAVKFSAMANTNATTSDFGGAIFKGVANSASPPVVTLTATSVDILGGGNKSRILTVTLTGATPTSGATFPVISTSSASTGTFATVTYSEPPVGASVTAGNVSGSAGIETWLSTGGSVAVTSAGGGTVGVTLTGCTMSSTVAGVSAGSENAATGTFTLDGTLQVSGITGI